jgi:hypothetical protein
MNKWTTDKKRVITGAASALATAPIAAAAKSEYVIPSQRGAKKETFDEMFPVKVITPSDKKTAAWGNFKDALSKSNASDVKECNRIISSYTNPISGHTVTVRELDNSDDDDAQDITFINPRAATRLKKRHLYDNYSDEVSVCDDAGILEDDSCEIYSEPDSFDEDAASGNESD